MFSLSYGMWDMKEYTAADTPRSIDFSASAPGNQERHGMASNWPTKAINRKTRKPAANKVLDETRVGSTMATSSVGDVRA
jgi:hypothetical protein